MTEPDDQHALSASELSGLVIRWNRLEDVEPKVSGDYLCCNMSGSMAVMYWRYGDFEGTEGLLTTSYDMAEIVRDESVTHWAELPSLPARPKLPSSKEQALYLQRDHGRPT
jgi:hypothetical protein